MAHIDLIETSVRDGNQSLWGATGLNTAMMLQIAPVMDQVGYAAIDFSTSARTWRSRCGSKGESLGAPSAHAQEHAAHALAIPNYGHAVYFLGTREPRIHAAYFSSSHS